MTDGMSSQQSRRSRSDLYDWIRTNSLAGLRIDIDSVLPHETPLSYIGTRPFLDPWQPKEAFATAPFIEVVKSKPRRKSGATLMANATGPPQLGAVDREDPIVRLKVAKVGLLSRKGESGSSHRMSKRDADIHIEQMTCTKREKRRPTENGRAGASCLPDRSSFSSKSRHGLSVLATILVSLLQSVRLPPATCCRPASTTLNRTKCFRWRRPWRFMIGCTTR